MDRILVINPGTTSTKLAVFEDRSELYREAVEHTDAELKPFSRAIDQLNFRKGCVLASLGKHGVSANSLTCIVSRGGMLPPCKTGAYTINDDMVAYVSDERNLREHISNVGCAVAYAIAAPLRIPAYIYDPVVVDELEPIARVTGLPEIEKQSRGHALNTRAMAIKCAEEVLKKPFAESTFIVQHLGGGTSVWLYHKGRAIDMYSDDDAGFAPERCGKLQAEPLIELCYSGKHTYRDMLKKVRGNAGLRAHLGTADARQVERMIDAGDARAALVYEAMAYSSAKGIGDLATVVCGKVDRIILTGGVAYSKRLTDEIVRRVSWIAPVELMPGEFELEALAAGALRVVRGEEAPHAFIWNR
ncbi:MAG TPA: butyrate kinase [Clostridia bacterium]|nr:butyrate kinase [Clostridia bacterium]